MEAFINTVAEINSSINSVVWGIPMLVLIIATGIFITARTKFFQVTRARLVCDNTFFAIFKNKSVRKSSEKKTLTQFQALSTALAATIGTGNIAGVATAITIGGAGAVFWMWVSAFFGMMTNYAENVLGIYYRRKNSKDEWSGGAMYYLKDGLNNKIGNILSVLFALFCVLASFGIGNMTQVNSISSAMYDSFNVPFIITGAVLAFAVALVLLGGVKRIGKVAETLVPFMALVYIIGSVIIVIMNITEVPGVFVSIFKGAFGFRAAAGGIAGAAIKQAVTMGFKRGVFSNEAGLGSSVMVHSASNVKEPVVQGMWGIFEVFADTMIVCTLTALVVLSTGVVTPLESRENDMGIITVSDGESVDSVNLYEYTIERCDYSEELAASLDKDSQVIVAVDENGRLSGVLNTDTEVIVGVDDKPGSETYGMVLSGVPCVSAAFSHDFGGFAGAFITIAILLFAFTTVLGWSFYGTKAFEYLFGTKATLLYKIVFVLFVVVGATMNLNLAWDIADTLNGLMAIPNLIGVLALSGTVLAITRNYIKRKVNGDTTTQPMLSIFPDIQAQQEDAIDEE